MIAGVERVNNHDMYYEIHGEGTPLVCMGGWGTFCHGGIKNAPRGIVENYQVLVFDYRGLGESTLGDAPATTAQYADDLATLMGRVAWSEAHLLGMVGMGACIAQELAIEHPDLVRSLTMTGTWARPDKMFADQLETFRDVHNRLGFLEFQLLVAPYSFDPEFYELNRDRLLGPDGAWGELAGRAQAHAQLIEACLTHDTEARLDKILAPTFVIHAGSDVLTGPRLTLPLEAGIPGSKGYLWEEVAHIVAGKEQKRKFDQLVSEFLQSVDS